MNKLLIVAISVADLQLKLIKVQTTAQHGGPSLVQRIFKLSVIVFITKEQP